DSLEYGGRQHLRSVDDLAVSRLDSLSRIDPQRRQEIFSPYGSQRDFHSHRRYLHPFHTGRVARTVGLDHLWSGLGTGNRRTDDKSSFWRPLYLAFSWFVSDYGVARSNRHAAAPAARARVRIGLDSGRRRGLHRRSRFLRGASPALCPLCLAFVRDCRDGLSLLRRALVFVIGNQTICKRAPARTADVLVRIEREAREFPSNSR